VWLIVLFFNVPPNRFIFFFFSQIGECYLLSHTK
jgi:hypothetical protein